MLVWIPDTEQIRGTFILHQQTEVENILDKYNMNDANRFHTIGNIVPTELGSGTSK